MASFHSVAYFQIDCIQPTLLPLEQNIKDVLSPPFQPLEYARRVVVHELHSPFVHDLTCRGLSAAEA